LRPLLHRALARIVPLTGNKLSRNLTTDGERRAL
jgi:hypothetical protein